MPPSTRPPALVARGPWYLTTPADLPALVAYLDALPNLHRWRPGATDTRRPREWARWYEKAAGLGRVEPATIVIDRATGAGHWVRVEGDTARVRPILDPLTVEPEPELPAAEQLGLFAQVEGRAA